MDASFDPSIIIFLVTCNAALMLCIITCWCYGHWRRRKEMRANMPKTMIHSLPEGYAIHLAPEPRWASGRSSASSAASYSVSLVATPSMQSAGGRFAIRKRPKELRLELAHDAAAHKLVLTVGQGSHFAKPSRPLYAHVTLCNGPSTACRRLGAAAVGDDWQPRWDETVHFAGVMRPEMHRVRLAVEIVAAGGRSLGAVLLGADAASGPGREHWNTVLCRGDGIVSAWHQLTKADTLACCCSVTVLADL